MPVLDPGRGRTKKDYAWAIARDDRPWGGTDPPAVVFHYAPGRGAEHAKALLAGYRSILQCDGYGAYKTLAAAGDAITLAFCWSHVRREFVELAKGRTAPIAQGDGDCREFRVWPVMMGKKELPHGPTQTASDPR